MSDPDVDVVEFMLTTKLFNDRRDLDPDDLPPAYRAPFWSDATIERPLTADQGAIAEATDVERPWEAISSLMFTDRDEFAGTVEFTDRDMAEEWFRKRVDADHVNANPVLAAEWEGQIDGVDYELAREQNRPARADRAFIDALLDDAFGNDGEDEEDGDNMLDLVDIRAPEEVQMTMDRLRPHAGPGGRDREDRQGHRAPRLPRPHRPARDRQAPVRRPAGDRKTSVARALAHDLQLPFVEVKLSMITSQYLGETAKNVEKTFEVAKRLAPCILFMDEFDFVAKTRSSDEHAAIKRAVNTLLKSIDEVSLIEDEVLLIGATNHPDRFDAAVWRRFDEIVNFPKPDTGMRSDILRVVTQQMDIIDFDPNALADITEGLTGSDLRLVLREAVLEALREDRTTLTQEDLRDAVTDFEERDNLKNLDMIEGDHDALVAGGDISGAGDSDSDAEAASDGGTTTTTTTPTTPTTITITPTTITITRTTTSGSGAGREAVLRRGHRRSCRPILRAPDGGVGRYRFQTPCPGSIHRCVPSMSSMRRRSSSSSSRSRAAKFCSMCSRLDAFGMTATFSFERSHARLTWAGEASCFSATSWTAGSSNTAPWASGA